MPPPPNQALALWNRLSAWPYGKWLFSRLVSFKAPYFASITARVESLEAGRCVVMLRKHRAVTNHIGTVHAIAICNMAELAAGTMCEASTPPSHRWIPKGMTVEYLKKAPTNLRATATFQTPPDFGPAPADVPVAVEVSDTSGQVVVRAVINIWISPRKAA
ncbi:MAG: DUF4442 domain-containing protein [Alphaproteobacteria bacterium]|nr:DUF4442 domain-containing protein [Alphaproteobacteria bacterium]